MMGKMAAAAAATIFCLVLQVYEVTKVSSSPVNVVVNGTVYLHPSLPVPMTYKEIIWRFNETQKILYKEPNKQVFYYDTPLKERLRYYENHTLEIKELQKQDSSTYEMALVDNKSEKKTSKIQLDVYELVPKPSVTVTNRSNKDGWCNATLVCTVNTSQVNYQWIKDEKDGLCKNSNTCNIELKSDSKAAYKCIVSNPSSQETGFIYHKHDCEWTEKNSAMSLSLARKAADSIMTFGFLLLIHTWV